MAGRHNMQELKKKVEDLEKRIADLRWQWPAHSVPAAMVEQLDELEEALEEARRALAEADPDDQTQGKSPAETDTLA